MAVTSVPSPGSASDHTVQLGFAGGRGRPTVDERQRTMIGIALVVAGLVALLATWAQIRDIQNVAAQVPYIASGGLLGVALAVIGGIALFAGSTADAAVVARQDALAAQIAELRDTVVWSADAIEQIAAFLGDASAAREEQWAQDAAPAKAASGARRRG